MVWFLASVNSHMSLEVPLLIKSFTTAFNRTDKLLLPCVLLHMLVQIELFGVTFVTPFVRTLKFLLLLMRCFMIREMTSCHEGFRAAWNGAWKGAVRIVNFLVIHELIYYIKAFSALFLETFIFSSRHSINQNFTVDSLVFLNSQLLCNIFSILQFEMLVNQGDKQGSLI